ncbi:hypothetical protein JCM8208_001296 [Rhodotorula glutinis]
MASRTATPQPWPQAGANPQGLQLPQANQAKGKGPARGTSAGPDGAANGAPEPPARATDVDSLMDAVGASGVDLGAEEESLRATNDRLQAQAMSAAGSSGGPPNPHTYAGIDRSRKQDFIDPGLLAECVKKVAAAFQLKTLEPDTIPLIALATRARLMSLVNSSIAARDHRQQASHFRVPPFVAPNPRKRRRRNPMDGEVDEDLDPEDDEDVEMDNGTGESGVKVPAWDTLVYDEPERLLAVLKRVETAEEIKTKRERRERDQRELEEQQLAEALEASEAARVELEEQEKAEARKDALEDEGGGGGGAAKKKKPAGGEAKAKGKGKELVGAAPATPGGKGSGAGGADTPSLGKDGKPKKKKKAKAGDDGPSGTSTPAPGGGGGAGASALKSSLGPGKFGTEDIKKRLADQTAMRSLGGRTFSWLNNGPVGSPTPGGAGPSTPGGLLPKAKFGGASGSPMPQPNFAPNGAGVGGAGAGAASTSKLNPANSSDPGAARGGQQQPQQQQDAAATDLMVSKLNVPQMTDAQRTRTAHDEWAAGQRVVEAQDLLFALDRERGMGTGRGSGRGAAVRGRAGIMRGAYRGGGGPLAR